MGRGYRSGNTPIPVLYTQHGADAANIMVPTGPKKDDLFLYPLKLDHFMREYLGPLAYSLAFVMPLMCFRVAFCQCTRQDDWILMLKLLFQLASMSLVQRC